MHKAASDKHEVGHCGSATQPAEAGIASVQGQPAARRPAPGAAEEAAQGRRLAAPLWQGESLLGVTCGVFKGTAQPLRACMALHMPRVKHKPRAVLEHQFHHKRTPSLY